jgi:hypothetical protein
VRHFINRLFAVLLLASFSAFLVPNELVHALYGHKDTCENSSEHARETVGTQHIHCDFLSFEAPVYTHASASACPVSFDHAFAFAATEEEQGGIIFSFHPSLRGPPAMV